MRGIVKLIIVIVLTFNFVYAAPFAPSPVCKIYGTIQSVEFIEAYNNSCLTDEINGCPTDTPLYYPDKYALGVKVDKVSYVSGETKYSDCDSAYVVGGKKIIFIKEEDVREGDLFEVGYRISGEISHFVNPNFDSTYSIASYDEGISEGGFCGWMSSNPVLIVAAVVVVLGLIFYFVMKKLK